MEKIRPYGPFEFDKKQCSDKRYVTNRWAAIEDSHPGLGSAAGIYIFCRKNGKNFEPVYVGRTGPKAGFASRVFSDDKFRKTIPYFNRSHGKMVILLLARRKPSLKGYAVISADDLEFLETICILWALRKNHKLTNVSKTRFSERMMIDGITTNFSQGNPGGALLSLRNAFDIKTGKKLRALPSGG